MSSVLILHGLNGDSQKNWIPWLKTELTKQGHQVWTPDLPQAEAPDPHIWTPFLLANKNFNWQDAIIVGHSAGSVEALHLLSALPSDVKVDSVFLVSSFPDDLGWPELKNHFSIPFNFTKIKQKAVKLITNNIFK